MPYALGIDLGSGRTTAAISRNDRERWLEPEVVALDGDPYGVASVLHVTAQESVEVGSAALRALSTRSGWVARGVADRIGDEIPVTLGGRPYPAEVLTAALVGWVIDYVEASEGVPASQLVITHPAGWGPHRRALLLSALREVNLPELTLLPRPVAAAESHAATERVEVGEEIAVHSLGTDRFESAVLRRGAFGFELRAHADGVETVGGGLFDDLLTEHVITSSGSSPEGVTLAKLRAACTEAKERLSTESSVTVSGVRVTRAEFEELIRPAVESTVQSLQRTIQAAGGEPPRAVVLVGGCGRIPLVTELVAGGTRARVVVAPEPETALARGAALAAARVAKPTVRATALTVTPEPIARAAVTHTDLMRLDDLPEEDLSDLGPPPPRPPVEITPLEPPKRRLLRLGNRDRAEEDNERDRRGRGRDEDLEFADLDLAPRRRERRRDPDPRSLTDIEGDFDLPEDDEVADLPFEPREHFEKGGVVGRDRLHPTPRATFEEELAHRADTRHAFEEAPPHRPPDTRRAFEDEPAHRPTFEQDPPHRTAATNHAFGNEPAHRPPDTRRPFEDEPAHRPPDTRRPFEDEPAHRPTFEEEPPHRAGSTRRAFEEDLAHRPPPTHHAFEDEPAHRPSGTRHAYEQDPPNSRHAYEQDPPNSRHAFEAELAQPRDPNPAPPRARRRNGTHPPTGDHEPVRPRHPTENPPPEPIRPRRPTDSTPRHPRHAVEADADPDPEPPHHRYREPARPHPDRDGRRR